MPNLWRTPDAQIAQRSAAFSIASEAIKPPAKGERRWVFQQQSWKLVEG